MSDDKDAKWERWTAEQEARQPQARRLTDALSTEEVVQKFNDAYRRNKEQAMSTEPVTTVTPFKRTDTGEIVQVERTEFPPITGYRTLSQEEVDLMNRVKAKVNELGALIEEIRKLPGYDARWLAIGTTHIQEGSMAICRSVTRPTGLA